MLTISKLSSAGQAQTYYKEEFAKRQESYSFEVIGYAVNGADKIGEARVYSRTR